MVGIDLLILLACRKVIILAVVLGVAALAGLASFVTPDVYTATTTIVPPVRNESAARSLAGQVEPFGSLLPASFSSTNPADPCIAMLTSRTIQDAIVKQFDLRHAYAVTSDEAARKKLRDRTEMLADKEGQVTVSVTDRDAGRAAMIANAFVEQLRSMYQNLSQAAATQRRRFYENQLIAERKALSDAELSLREAQEKTGLVQLDPQTQSIVETVANARAEMGIAEARLEAMRIYATPENPDLQRTEAEVTGLRTRLANLERSTEKLGEGNLEIPAWRLPQVELEYVRAARDLKNHEAIYEFLNKQTEAARLDEAQPGALVEVLDAAKVPDTRSGPHRLLVVLVSVMSAFLVCCLGIMTTDAIRCRKQQQAQPCVGTLIGDLGIANSETSFFPLAVSGTPLELCALLAALGLGILAFDFGWLSPAQAAAGTALFLCCLDFLAWRNFDQGRHPVFLFLCVLTLLQTGRALAYLFGDGAHPLRIAGIAPQPFDLTRTEGGTVLLCLALSALCIYGVCRWNYRSIAPPSEIPVVRYLPFLYLVFYATIPIQLSKNYSYYHFIQSHGGYLYFWTHHGDIISSVPLIVRAIVLINAPAFLAIFVFERRTKWLYLATISYFATTIFTLLIGFRSSAFVLILVLWYVAKVKSNKKSRLVGLVALALFLTIVGGLIQTIREDQEASLSNYVFAPLEFVRLEGDSIDVTAATVKYEKMLAPYGLSYLWYDLQDAFALRSVHDYVPGQRLPNDISVLLNPVAFARGRGDAGSYLAQMYLLGGVAGVVILSLLLGGGLHLLHRFSRDARTLFVVASIMPVIILMPRGQLLDWASDLLKTGISVAILWFGWLLYCTIMWLRGTPVLQDDAAGL